MIHDAFRSLQRARGLAGALAVLAISSCVTPAPREGAQPAAKDAAAASAFIAKSEAELADLSEFAAHADWVRNTYIMYDSNWLSTKVGEDFLTRGAALAKEAAAYDETPGLAPETRRKLELLKRGLTLAPPDTPGAAKELAQISTDLEEKYSAGKFTLDGWPWRLDDAERAMAASRDPKRLQAVWQGWHTISPPMREEYARMVAIANAGAKQLGYADTGAMWRAKYDMPAADFENETDRLWGQVQPLYTQLHCYVRARLNAKYGDAVQPRTGPIRADLLGNMWAQEWGNIYDLVAPKGPGPGYDVTQRLKAQHYTPLRMMKTGEAFFTSMGFEKLPDTFWERSMITRPRDREVVCHASAWNVDNADDLRIKMCTQVNEEDFQTIHHELGHNFYQRAYNRQPFLFRDGANDGFHEAIGDMQQLSITPEYLQKIGLISKVPPASADTALLLRRAMDKVAFLPFGLLVDKWRWEVFSGAVAPEQYNDAWWKLRLQYQGITPPGARPADAFDPGAKYHVPGNTPYMRYFLAHIYQFQFYRAACQQAGWKGPLHRCTIYGDKAVGAKFNAMLEMGASKPWPDALEAFTGQREIDASAVTDYFAPLMTWLEAQNKNEKCGW
ncbi:MAG: M2 family metallopeptidase [Hyphomonadaceae bacterium]